jgi:MarR family transcriptional regulator for hemolysin
MEEELVTLRAQALKGVSRSDLEAALRVLNAFTTDAAGRAEQRGAEPAPATGKTRKAAKAPSPGKGEADAAAPHHTADPA